MTDLEELRRQADAQKAKFFYQAEAIPKILRPVRVVDELLAILDPQYKTLMHIKHKVTSKPVAVLAVVAGLVWLARQLASRPFGDVPKAAKSVQRSSRAHLNTKGVSNGNQFTSNQ